MKARHFLVITLIVSAFFLLLRTLSRRNNPLLFRPFVRAYHKLDARLGITTCDNVFTGSSVMKFWESLEQDLAPYPVINRAIPGTKIGEIAYYADELVNHYQPKRVFLYAGSNDIQGSTPRTAEQVLDGFKDFVTKVRSYHPRINIFYISILISPSKWRIPHREEIERANTAIRGYCHATPGLHFIDLASHFLDEAGNPRKELFLPDGIHLKRESYTIWNNALRNYLQEDNR